MSLTYLIEIAGESPFTLDHIHSLLEGSLLSWHSLFVRVVKTRKQNKATTTEKPPSIQENRISELGET